MPRGVIENRAEAQRIRDFSGLRYGNITPTDIDGLLDFGNKVFVLIEVKRGNTKLPYGQRLAIERIVDRLGTAIGIVGRYYNAEGDIDFANCEVDEVRSNREWKSVSGKTVRQMIDRFLEWTGNEAYLDQS